MFISTNTNKTLIHRLLPQVLSTIFFTIVDDLQVNIFPRNPPGNVATSPLSTNHGSPLKISKPLKIRLGELTVLLT